MVNRKKDNFIISIIIILIVIIFLCTVYFTLDVFGIIKVPAKYSIASLFYSRIEVIASGAHTIDDENVINRENKKKVVVQNNVSKENLATNVEDPLDLMPEYTESSDNNSIEEEQLNTDRFYYNQLDQYGKILYDELYNNKDKLKTGTFVAEYGNKFDNLLKQENGEDVLNKALDSAMNSLVLDNPELFYIDITKMYLLTNITTRILSTTYEVSISGNGDSYLEEGFNSEEEVNVAISNIENIKNEIISNTSGNTVDKIRYVHNYLIDTVEYDVNAGTGIRDVYGTLINQKAVCEGYAKAFKYIMDELEIPCILVCGTATNSVGVTENHAWNYVQIDGVWYAVDVTWDDPIIRGELLGDLPDDIRYGYFLNGSEKFFQNHVEDEQLLDGIALSYPELSITNF